MLSETILNISRFCRSLVSLDIEALRVERETVTDLLLKYASGRNVDERTIIQQALKLSEAVQKEVGNSPVLLGSHSILLAQMKLLESIATEQQKGLANEPAPQVQINH